MKINRKKISKLIVVVDEIITNIRAEEQTFDREINQTCAEYTRSARNLVHYQALRKQDLRKLQKSLRDLGLSRLANADGHVMASLLNTRYILQSLLGQAPQQPPRARLTIKKANKLLEKNVVSLLGEGTRERRVRIMVTQPTQAATDYDMVNEMVARGMDCARVNCAHDEPETWEKMIDHVHKAAQAHDRSVKIAMDLAGPKIRTGSITPGRKVRRFSPQRNEIGEVINPAVFWLLPAYNEEFGEPHLPVDENWLSALKVGDEVHLTDTRQKTRVLKVVETGVGAVKVQGYETAYIGTGTVLTINDGQPIEVGEIPPVEQALLLRTDDLLTIHQGHLPGAPSQYNEEGNLLAHAHIGCQLDSVFAKVQIGEQILFDDGKIEGAIEAVRADAFDVRITRAREGGAKLKAEKGINFPTTDLGISGLTNKDKEDLKFVAAHADIVNFSFVNSRADVEELLVELEKLGAKNKLSIILKIETQRAFDNLTEILLAAMNVSYLGVMIARGDLAVETGWDQVGRIQNEILALSGAAHVPVVWATQVLENLAKKGLPSRSEITDATSSLKAECVMLNKGPYINNAIGLLDGILTDMERFQEKKNAMLPQMSKLIEN